MSDLTGVAFDFRVPVVGPLKSHITTHTGKYSLRSTMCDLSVSNTGKMKRHI